ncbi:maleylpyruvate isomerase N-terminal domain-containing protein [Micromonospora sp. LOL_024]|uniref:maleylpyruvate isomerase N-terminal domain-containing protein n=1 Tax=Micromonospora sp. LOL_024 TaxID=3345412 RepID=UPI003A8A2CD2
MLGQRRLLADTLAGFDEAAWSAQSRCTAWSNRDVVVHLSITNRTRHRRRGWTPAASRSTRSIRQP